MHSIMDELDVTESEQAGTDVGAMMTALGAAGAMQFDPLRWHYIEALWRRASTSPGNVRRILDAKLKHALTTFEERFGAARRDAEAAITGATQSYPNEADTLRRLLASGDVKAVHRTIAALHAGTRRPSLAELVQQLDHHASANAVATVEARAEARTAARPELKAIRNFRTTWAKLSVDRQMARALAQAPKNAGPINSHMLVLRSLTAMRDISPDYLNRFMSYADTLLRLDQSGKPASEAPPKPRTAKATKADKAAKAPKPTKKQAP